MTQHDCNMTVFRQDSEPGFANAAGFLAGGGDAGEPDFNADHMFSDEEFDFPTLAIEGIMEEDLLPLCFDDALQHQLK